jgi:hypothetical protein
VTTNAKEIGWQLWLQWLVAYILAIALATRIAFEVRSIGSGTITHAVMGVTAINLYGFIVGLVQWLVLSHYGISLWWIVATLMGFTFLIYFTDSLLGAATIQCFLLWRRVYGSGVWIVAHVPAYYLSSVKYHILYDMISKASSNWPVADTPFFVQIVIGSVSAVITATALVWLVRHPKLENTSMNRLL